MSTNTAIEHERWQLLTEIERWLERPMQILGLVWVALVAMDLVVGLDPVSELAVSAIWILFIVDFVLRFWLAPSKLRYLRSDWLTLVSLVLPGLRFARITRAFGSLRAARAVRSVRLLKLLGSLNRGMQALRATFRRRGFGYAVLLTAIVTLAGAAGMYQFESGGEHPRGLPSYGSALWWTAMLMTTIGSQYWPETAEGRFLCFVLSVYALGILGYVTATLATFFVGRDAERDDAEIAGERSILALRREIGELRAELRGRGAASVDSPAEIRSTAMTNIEGGCLCGAVRYTSRAEPVVARACWCRVCQYFAAGNATINLAFPRDAVTISGELSDYPSAADSGNRMHRRFCPVCGVHLFSEAEERPHLIIVRAGTLDDPALGAPRATIWTASAPSWAHIDPELERFEGQPPAPSAKR